MGREDFKRIVEENKGNIVHKSDHTAQRAFGIAQRIIRNVENNSPKQCQDFEWHLVVVNDDNVVNAGCVPGGYIIVWTGLINLAKSDDELAAVLAHEISHALLRHSAELYCLARILVGFHVLFTLLFENGIFTGILSRFFIFLPHSRRLEHEADKVGLQLMTDACYDPGAISTMFKSLEDKLEHGSKTIFGPLFSTHPFLSDRLRELNIDVSILQGEYGAKCDLKNFDAPPR